MSLEWYTHCNNCGIEFGYSDSSIKLSKQLGLPRPEHCPACEIAFARDLSNTDNLIKHFVETGYPKQIHRAQENYSNFDFHRFGITDDHIRDFLNLTQKHKVTVIIAPSGSGKSTLLPYRLMVPPDPFPQDLFTQYGQIVITQPRIQATRNLPAFIAHELHGSNYGAGFDIGFRSRYESMSDWRNKLIYMTDGSLIDMIVNNELHRLSVIMIDEAHEQSLNISLVLGLLKAQMARYPNLKLIIASATGLTNMFINFFGGPNSVGLYEFQGKRQFQVETRFWESDPIPETQMSGRMPIEVAKKAFSILLSMDTGKEPKKGDILAFLNSVKSIEQAINQLREYVDGVPRLAGKVDIYPLYLALSNVSQDRAMMANKDTGRYKVVISTSVAETSITIPGIVHVIDSGLINESQWDSETQTSYVITKLHSQLGCIQRWGRAGRDQDGIAHCLYTQQQYETLTSTTNPDIQRVPLESAILSAKSAGINNIHKFDWFQRPSDGELTRAIHHLQQIKALDIDTDITDHGLELSRLYEEADISNLLILADRFGCAIEIATLIPMLKIGPYTSFFNWNRNWDGTTKHAINRIHQGLTTPCLDDIEIYLKLWVAWEGAESGQSIIQSRELWARRFFLHEEIFENIASERRDLLDILFANKKDDSIRPVNFNLLNRVRIILLYGLPHRVYQRDNLVKSGNEFSNKSSYYPYNFDLGRNSNQINLRVEISSRSICFKKDPGMFVCGKLQRTSDVK